MSRQRPCTIRCLPAGPSATADVAFLVSNFCAQGGEKIIIITIFFFFLNPSRSRRVRGASPSHREAGGDLRPGHARHFRTGSPSGGQGSPPRPYLAAERDVPLRHRPDRQLPPGQACPLHPPLLPTGPRKGGAQVARPPRRAGAAEGCGPPRGISGNYRRHLFKLRTAPPGPVPPRSRQSSGTTDKGNGRLKRPSHQPLALRFVFATNTLRLATAEETQNTGKPAPDGNKNNRQIAQAIASLPPPFFNFWFYFK